MKLHFENILIWSTAFGFNISLFSGSGATIQLWNKYYILLTLAALSMSSHSLILLYTFYSFKSLLPPRELVHSTFKSSELANKENSENCNDFSTWILLIDGEGNSWLHKLGMNTNKWSFLNSLVGWSENRALEKGIFI